jgi:transposase-like protein
MRAHAAGKRGDSLVASLGALWCRAMHDNVSWPVQGHYRCRKCNRVYEVPWEDRRPSLRREVRAEPVRTALQPAEPRSIAA